MSGRQVIERVLKAPLGLVWEMWTTPEGIGSWMGPGRYEVHVTEIDLRVGGAFVYQMKAPEGGSPAHGGASEWEVRSTFTVVEPQRALAYDSPWGEDTMSTSVTFDEVDGGVKMVLVIDATKPEMTTGAAKGWQASVAQLEARLAAV